MSSRVWGKFKLPSAKAAPKFLLAEGEGKRFSLPQLSLRLFLHIVQRKLQGGNYPKMQQGRMSALDAGAFETILPHAQ